MNYKIRTNMEKNRENREKLKFSLFFKNILKIFRKIYISENYFINW